LLLPEFQGKKMGILKVIRLSSLFVCLCWSGALFAATSSGVASESSNTYGGILGFSGSFGVSKWTTGSNSPSPSLVDLSHAPEYVVMKNYAAWATSGATMGIKVPGPGVVSFQYSYTGQNPSECPFVFTKSNDEGNQAVRTTLDSSSGYKSFYITDPYTQIRFALNGKDEPNDFGCSNPAGIETTLTISKFSYQPPVLIRPFGDSITYGFGFTDYKYCPTYIDKNNLFARNWCTQPKASDGGGYRGWLTEKSLQFQLLLFKTEGYQNGGSTLQQWYTATQAHDGYPGFCTTKTVSSINRCNEDYLEKPSVWLSFSDITLVHAGTNDILVGRSAEDTYTGLTTIIDNLLAANEKAHLFVAKIIRFYPNQYNKQEKVDTWNTTVTDYNNMIQNAYGNG